MSLRQSRLPASRSFRATHGQQTASVPTAQGIRSRPDCVKRGCATRIELQRHAGVRREVPNVRCTRALVSTASDPERPDVELASRRMRDERGALGRSKAAAGLVELAGRSRRGPSCPRFACRTRQHPTSGAELEQQHRPLLDFGIPLRSGARQRAVRRLPRRIAQHVGPGDAIGRHGSGCCRGVELVRQSCAGPEAEGRQGRCRDEVRFHVLIMHRTESERIP